jgi:hypothetical protein
MAMVAGQMWRTGAEGKRTVARVAALLAMAVASSELAAADVAPPLVIAVVGIVAALAVGYSQIAKLWRGVRARGTP